MTQTTAKRMKWLAGRVGEWWLFRSECGRFVIGGREQPPGSQGWYFTLTDATTGAKHCCRTIESAKTAARNLATGA